MASGKKYGLIIPAKKKAGTVAGKIAKPSVFGDSSSDEEVVEFSALKSSYLCHLLVCVAGVWYIKQV